MYPTSISHHHPFFARALWLVIALLLAIFHSGQAALAASTSAGQAQLIVQHWLARDATPLGAALSHRVAGVTPYGRWNPGTWKSKSIGRPPFGGKRTPGARMRITSAGYWEAHEG